MSSVEEHDENFDLPRVGEVVSFRQKNNTFTGKVLFSSLATQTFGIQDVYENQEQQQDGVGIFLLGSVQELVTISTEPEQQLLNDDVVSDAEAFEKVLSNDLKGLPRVRVDNELVVLKDLFIESAAIKNMTQGEVESYRKKLRLVVSGNNVVRPIESWSQCGLFTKADKFIGFEKPSPVQCQGIPVLMSGRDTLLLAKSGKMLAYILPMLRHAWNQPRKGLRGLVLIASDEGLKRVASTVYGLAKAYGLKSASLTGDPKSDCRSFKAIMREADILIAPPKVFEEIVMHSVSFLERVTFLVLHGGSSLISEENRRMTNRVVKRVSPKKQLVVCDSEMSREVEKWCSFMMADLVKVEEDAFKEIEEEALKDETAK